MQMGYSEWMVMILVGATLAASWNDYRRHRVPNWLNAAVLVTGVIMQSMFSGWVGLQTAIGGVLVGLAPLFVLWMMKAMGAGDVKFMAALGAWLGPQLTFQALIVGGLVGGVIAVGMIAAGRNWRRASANLTALASKMSSFETVFAPPESAPAGSISCGAIPYAIPLSIGTLVVVLSDYFGWWRGL